MNTIVRKHYPVVDLPEELRHGFPADARVRVTIEPEPVEAAGRSSVSEFFAARCPPYLTTEKIVDDVRSDREAWE